MGAGNSVVRTASRYGLDGPLLEHRWGKRFLPLLVRPDQQWDTLILLHIAYRVVCRN